MVLSLGCRRMKEGKGGELPFPESSATTSVPMPRLYLQFESSARP